MGTEQHQHHGDAIREHLAGKVARLEAQLREAEAREQALAAHVERWRRGIYWVDGWAAAIAQHDTDDVVEWGRHLLDWAGENSCCDMPTTPLARRDAEKKAEALEAEVENGDYGLLARERLSRGAKFYRSEAEQADTAGRV